MYNLEVWAQQRPQEPRQQAKPLRRHRSPASPRSPASAQRWGSARGRRPEPQSTIREQFRDLTDPNHSREFMIYNKGDTPIPLPDENLYGQTHLKDGQDRPVRQEWAAWPQPAEGSGMGQIE